jgi:hypothetical protein
MRQLFGDANEREQGPQWVVSCRSADDPLRTSRSTRMLIANGPSPHFRRADEHSSWRLRDVDHARSHTWWSKLQASHRR